MALDAIASKSTSGAKGLSRRWTFQDFSLPALSGRVDRDSIEAPGSSVKSVI